MHAFSTRLPLLVLLCIASAAPLRAAEPADRPRAVTPSWHLRLRHEHVDDDAFAAVANATTLRLRAGVNWKGPHGIGALLEGEAIAADGRYNSGANGQVSRPLVPDARGSELNQAWVDWHGEHLRAVVGRQRLLMSNPRWLGNGGWRQNEQTFDAVSVEWKNRNWAVRHAWLDRVHRVSGDRARDRLARERDLDTHALEASWARDRTRLSAYALWHEDQDVPGSSSATHGVRATTGALRDGRGWGVTVEWAQQRDHADNPLRFRHDYWLVEPSLTVQGTIFRAGWEHLGGNGRHALQTPLATLHAFNGWADKFNVTPPGGLDDRYLAAGGKLRDGKLDWQVAWHDYRADTGGRLGRELNASLAFPVYGGIKGLVKVADYRADRFAQDTVKTWLQLEWSH